MCLFEEKKWFYDFTIDGSTINRNIDFGIGNMKQGDVLAIIRYRLKYTETSNIMQDLLTECLNDIPWIPYDYEMRRKVCCNAYKKLEMYIRD